MLNKKILDLYTDYLISSFSQTTATGLSAVLNQSYSHDKITRFLSAYEYSQKDYWFFIKSLVRQIEWDDGILIVDDTIEEKPYTDENNIVCWHYDHTKGRTVKGINIINFLYQVSLNNSHDFSLPFSYEVVVKDQEYTDKNGKKKRKSKVTKNEMVRRRLEIITYQNRVKFKYIVFDSWFSSKANMEFIKNDLKKHFVGAVKSNRLVALSYEDKLAGKFIHVSEVDIKPNGTVSVYLKGVDFPVVLTKQIFTNKDESVGVLYLVSSDTQLTFPEFTTIYHKRWKVEEFHKSLKQNVSLEKSPTKTETTQKNHIFAAMLAFVKLEKLKLKTKSNHFALKMDLYIRAIQTAFKELKTLQSLVNVDNFIANA